MKHAGYSINSLWDTTVCRRNTGRSRESSHSFYPKLTLVHSGRIMMNKITQKTRIVIAGVDEQVK
jgi:hypothetical protein